MKKMIPVIYIFILSVLLLGCGNNSQLTFKKAILNPVDGLSTIETFTDGLIVKVYPSKEWFEGSRRYSFYITWKGNGIEPDLKEQILVSIVTSSHLPTLKVGDVVTVRGILEATYSTLNPGEIDYYSIEADMIIKTGSEILPGSSSH